MKVLTTLKTLDGINSFIPLIVYNGHVSEFKGTDIPGITIQGQYRDLYLIILWDNAHFIKWTPRACGNECYWFGDSYCGGTIEIEKEFLNRTKGKNCKELKDIFPEYIPYIEERASLPTEFEYLGSHNGVGVKNPRYRAPSIPEPVICKINADEKKFLYQMEFAEHTERQK